MDNTAQISVEDCIEWIDACFGSMEPHDDMMLDAIRSRLMSQQWQPIENAPKNGSVFLVCLPRMMNLIIRARYNRVHQYFITDELDSNSLSRPAFFHDGDLWQPLPQPPKEPS